MSIGRKKTLLSAGVGLLLLATFATAMFVRKPSAMYDVQVEEGRKYVADSYESGDITELMPWILVEPIDGPLSIDRLIEHTANECNVELVGQIDDAAYLRRVYIDLIGRIPRYDEYDMYMRQPPETRRRWVVNRLLNDWRFNARWTVFFGDMFRIRQNEPGGRDFTNFIRESLAQRKSYDEMVREMVTAIGGPRNNPGVGFIANDDAEPLELAGVVTQTLMGVRMKCAQCHDHPFDDWTREEYYSIAAYFSHTGLYDRNNDLRIMQVTRVNEPRVMWPPTPGIKSKPQRPMQAGWPFDLRIADAELIGKAIDQKQKIDAVEAAEIDEELFDTSDAVTTTNSLDIAMKRTSDSLASVAKNYKTTPMRDKLADRLTNPTNPYFTWNICNRVWAELMGGGIVQPVDDFRGDNPPSHPQLLDYLATQFIASDYDLRSLVKKIVLSDAYSRKMLADQDAPEREMAERLFAAAPLRRMMAETIYDSIITAGRLDNRPKDRKEDFLVDREYTIATATNLDEINRSMDEELQKELVLVGPEDRTYTAEGDFFDQLFENQKDPLNDLRLLAIGDSELIPAEIIEEARRRVQERYNGMVEYKYEKVTRQVDTRPRFQQAMFMASPAPSEHFLRQFGQTGRVLLGEKRDEAPNMRQSLILMNGQLANEAARVGKLEPVYSLLQSDLSQAVTYAYIECLTRKPTADELDMAISIIETSATPEAGMADLRWALLNCHAFRYLP